MAGNNQNLDTVLGVLGLVSVPPVLGALIYNLLPCTRLQELEQIFSETEGMLQKNTEAGLLGTRDMVSGFHRRLEMLRGQIDDARAESHSATTYAQNFKKMLAGLSRRIYSLSGEVKKLRADISTTTARERERLREAQSFIVSQADPSQTSTSGSPLSPLSRSAPLGEDSSSVSLRGTEAINDNARDECASTACQAADAFHPPPHLSNPDSIMLAGGSTATVDASSQSLVTTAPPSSDSTAFCAGDRGDPVPHSAESLERSRLSSSPSARGSISRHKRYDNGLSRVRVLPRLFRGRPNRARSSSSSTRSLMLVPSRTLEPIGHPSDGDDAEWEDVDVC
ncbi:hypothetical protein PYCCODRAFT_1459843 [Trametes coccinea BRFM310]|uniref:Uncharacterized protein n=1 Tax=Trametes coccinea (strain BRFM310) TaxID=1353009 RepID=A0A1Y2IJ18_TRAC3|nr:hypothetical protein PYCCODRAFT_1459843 [Trametes coccinea BRFM310]